MNHNSWSFQTCLKKLCSPPIVMQVVHKLSFGRQTNYLYCFPACTIRCDSRCDFGVVVERAYHNFLEGVPSPKRVWFLVLFWWSFWCGFRHLKLINPINLGAKRKVLSSSFRNCPWIWDFDLNWPRYDRNTEPHQELWKKVWKKVWKVCIYFSTFFAHQRWITLARNILSYDSKKYYILL